MKRKLIKQAYIVNEGKTTISDLLIVDDRIEKVSTSISHNNKQYFL